jgi:hypothetical protein
VLSFLEIIMLRFTIEITYRLAVYRQRTSEAETLKGACQLAVNDDLVRTEGGLRTLRRNLRHRRLAGRAHPYRVGELTVPSRFGETIHRKADHFETLLGILKLLAHAPDAPFWRQRADAAILKAEAILAGAPDPEIEETRHE